MSAGPLDHLILFFVGAAAGALNVLAGGGSFLTLPVLILLGLPPTVANGTNRIAILAQNVTAVAGFHRHRLVDPAVAVRAAVPALAGVGLGAWAAIEVGDETFRRALAIIMVVVSLWTLWDPSGRRTGAAVRPDDRPRFRSVGFGLAFFGVGLYGGFVQAGVGFLMLATTTWAGINLVRGNALKVLVALCFTPLALVLFAAGGKVEWVWGIALAAGHVAGALIGVRLTMLKGHAWLKRVVTAAVIGFAILLWIAP